MQHANLYHEAKSKYAYIYDEHTIHLRLRASKHQISSVQVIYGDPFFWGPKEDDLDSWEWKISTSKAAVMTKEYETADNDHFFLEVSPEFKRMKYAFLIDNQYLYGCRETVDILQYPDQKKNLFNYFNFPYLNEEDIFDAPKWIEDQVWYSIFPERFSNGDPSINPSNVLPWGETNKYSNQQRFGGDLKGIIQRLDHIKQAGFTGIYMTPIFKADTSHKYDTVDYFQIDPAFGDNETFKELVQTAHSKGIKVMLDAVFNHCGFNHPYFQDVVTHHKQSKYYDCFYILDDTKDVITFPLDDQGQLNEASFDALRGNPQQLNYRTFAFTPAMPKWNTSHPLVKQYLLEVATFWIKEYDIDGWRLDVSNEVSHSFWREFRTAVKTAKPDAYIVGENWDNSNPWLLGDQYDGVMNYEILFPIWNFFGTNIDHLQYSATQFKHTINKVLTDYPKNVLKSLYNLVDSHDTTRILEICGNDPQLVKLPYLFLFTFPGAPSIYYGGEVGLSGKHDPDNRRCMIWDSEKQNHDLFHFIKRLITLRSTYHAFKSTSIKWIETNDKKEYIIYQKDDLFFILSKRYNGQTITLPEELQHVKVLDVYSNRDIELSTKLEIGSYGFFIFQKQ